MTRRAVIIGLLLGLILAAFGYFNDFVMNQAYVASDLVPISVYGFLVLGLLLANPLLRWVRGWEWMAAIQKSDSLLGWLQGRNSGRGLHGFSGFPRIRINGEVIRAEGSVVWGPGDWGAMLEMDGNEASILPHDNGGRPNDDDGGPRMAQICADFRRYNRPQSTQV